MNADARTPSDPDRIEWIKVWDIPTRIFHWLLVVSFAGAWLTRSSERWREAHEVFGYTIGGLIAFRFVWGFAGSYYARFSAFPWGPAGVLAYLRSLASGHPERHVGHTPAGALAALTLLVLGVLMVGSGIAVGRDFGGDELAALHAWFGKLMLAVAVIHLAGVLACSVAHRENLVLPMIHGRKCGRHAERIGRSRAAAGLALLFSVLGYWTVAFWRG